MQYTILSWQIDAQAEQQHAVFEPLRKDDNAVFQS